MAEYVNPDVLISDEELEPKLGDPSIRVVEVDEDTSLYGKGHIPGAIAWNWKTELHDPLRREFIDQKQLAALLKKSGVGPDTTVVLYAGNNNWFSAYTYWLLRYLGFDNVKLLNGGRKKWELESRELTSDVPDVAPASSAPKSWSSPAYMVSTTMPIVLLVLRSARVASRPLPSGRRRSMITTSGWRAPAWRTASAAVAASPTTSNCRSRSNACRRPLRMRSWSSTSSTLVRVVGVALVDIPGVLPFWC